MHIHLPLEGLQIAARRFGIGFDGFRKDCGPLYRSDDVGHLLGTQFVRALDHQGAAARMYADGIAQSLVAHLLRHYDCCLEDEQVSIAKDDGLRVAFDYVESQSGEEIGVARLASLAGMSEFHFLRRFKQRYGITPHAHVVNARLRLAKADLMSSNKNILQIAMDRGFSNSSHLARAFRKAEGMTPQDYRKARGF
ncbi:transcriptional regulator GlxA family with amidase domain [Variovorax boronicumulans]|nr:transcriptional regulator GlxA family with amidase domain [Variovorax boronicumulans]